ncbi:PKD domain-containing protein [Sulfidibacter corallicola]|uniref:PKD domain-containing protein n=1 Tax=Sulfidibacter corallicola TaxID=2818388 RepID=A0A8A4TDG9_SULCO|nr:PKD domain-containing protein [Sulfidibacter corallicola]QTD48139.1 PKD domain-containing protein [Sulfidibacter corallicola]
MSRLTCSNTTLDTCTNPKPFQSVPLFSGWRAAASALLLLTLAAPQGLWAGGNMEPDGAIDLPAMNTTIPEGGSVTFEGTGNDPDGNTPLTFLWDFDGGATNSTDEDPGAVTFNTAGVYTVTFTVTDSLALADPTPAQVVITVNAPPDGTIDLPLMDTTIAEGDSVTFGGTASDPDGNTPLTFLWNFDGGATNSTDEDPGAVTFSTAGVYNVTFTATDSLGLADPTPATVEITVNARPSGTIDLPIANTTIAEGESVTFEGSGSDPDGHTPLTFLWDFDGGATNSTDEDPGMVTFDTPGVYDVAFTVTDNLGLADAIPAMVTITVNARPDGTIDSPATDVQILPSGTVNFQGSGTDAENNLPLTYDWFFDGAAGNSNLEDPGLIAFAAVGHYDVTLTVTDSLGADDLSPATRRVTVSTPPVATIDLPMADATIGTGETVTFGGGATDADGDLSFTFLWDFDGGATNSTVEDPGAVQFDTPGLYTVSFTATDSLGVPSVADTVMVRVSDRPDASIDAPVGPQTVARGEALTFGATGSDPDDSTPLTYLWDFGGGAANIGVEDPGSVQFNTNGMFTVTLTVTDSFGLEDLTPPTLTVTVTDAPNGTIDAPATNQVIATGESVSFTGTSSDPDNSTPLTFLWDFGGGATNSMVEDPGSVTFNTAGVYTVTFTVTDALGIADPTPGTVQVTVTDRPDGTITAPATDLLIETGSSVNFSADASDPDNNTPLTYLWDFDGGATNSTIEDPGNVAFDTPGVYDVTFTVTDALGFADLSPDTVRITVTDAPESTIDLPASNTTVLVNGAVTFEGTATDADNNTPLTFLWDFDGGATNSTTEDPGPVTFDTPGIYQVTFTATDALGMADPTPDTVQLIVTHAPEGTIDAPVTDQVIATGTTLNFQGTVTDADDNTPFTYLWDFDGGATNSTDEDPGDVTFNSVGVFDVTFTATDAFLVSDQTPATLRVTVTDAPSGTITSPAGNQTIDVGDSLNFAGAASDPDNTTPLSFLWEFDGAVPDQNVEDPGVVTFNTAGVYDVTFTVTDALGISDPTPATLTVTVNGPPNGTIDTPVGNQNISVGESLNFTGTGTDPDNNTPLTYLWDFDGGAANSTTEDPGSVQFDSPGSFTVRFTVTDSLGQVDPTPATMVVNVANAPAGIIDEPATGPVIIAPGASVFFLGSVIDPDNATPYTYLWNFDGGATNSVVQDPGNVVFLNHGTYDTTFQVTNGLGIADPSPPGVTVIVSNRPESVIDSPAGPVNVGVGGSVSFAGSGSDPDGDTPLTYLWTFDGAAPDSALEDPGAVTFNATGTYTVTLTATDSLGAPDDTPATVVVTVTDPPDGTIDTPAANLSVATGGTVSFTGSASDPDNNLPLTHLWDFDGGATNSTTEDPGAIQFDTPGVYTVTYTVTDALGVVDPTPDTVTVSVTDPPDGTIDAPASDVTIPVGGSVTFAGSGVDPDNDLPLTFLWDFDGGATNSTVEDPGEITFDNGGTFTVTFTVSDAQGIADPTPATVVVTVTGAPESTIDEPTGPVTVTVGESVTFAGSGNDPDGDTPLTYAWDFDGAAPASTEEDPGAIQFDTPGEYEVTLTVTDARGIADPTPASVTVTVGDTPNGTIDTPAEDVIIAVGESVNFTASGNDPGGHLPLDFQWDFGGGASDSNVEDPGDVTFNSVGNFTVTLTVTNDIGLEDPVPATITVTVSERPVGAIDTPTGQVTIVTGQTVDFTGSATDADNTTPFDFAWDFGGGAANQSVEDPGEVAFDTPGVYTVVMTVTDALGLEDLTPPSVTVRVSDEPDGTIDSPAGDMIIGTGESLNFTATAVDSDNNLPLTHFWDFGGGASDANVEDPGAVTFDTPGIYTVSYQVTDAFGIVDPTPAEITVTVADRPESVINDPVADMIIGSGSSLLFSATGSDTGGNQPLSYFWTFAGVVPDSAERNPGEVLFANAGIFDITLTVTNSLGLEDLTPATVRVTVTDAPEGTIDEPAASVVGVAPGESVTFSATATDADNTNPLTFAWSFDGGATDVTVEDPGSVAFADPGVYQVTFTVTDGLGIQDPTPATRTIVVSSEVAGFIDHPTNSVIVNPGTMVEFAGTGGDPANQTPLSFLWTFDGAAPDSTLEDPGFLTFDDPGSYAVRFIVTNAIDVADPDPPRRTIFVNDPPTGTIEQPTGDVSIPVGASVSFQASSADPNTLSGLAPDTDLAVLWDFDGGAPNSTVEDPGTVVFQEPGVFDVTFTVTDSRGAPDPNPPTRRIVVGSAPDGTIESPVEEELTINLGDSLDFAGSAIDPDNQMPLTFAWDFDGAAPPSDQMEPGTILFDQQESGPIQQHLVTFTVTNNLDITDPIPDTTLITVNRPPAGAELRLVVAGGESQSSGTPTVLDPDVDDTHLFEIVDPPEFGLLEESDGTFTYTVAPDRHGSFEFTFRATDPGGFEVLGQGVILVLTSKVYSGLLASWPDPPIIDCLTPGDTECQNDIDTLLEIVNNPDVPRGRLGKRSRAFRLAGDPAAPVQILADGPVTSNVAPFAGMDLELRAAIQREVEDDLDGAWPGFLLTSVPAYLSPPGSRIERWLAAVPPDSELNDLCEHSVMARWPRLGMVPREGSTFDHGETWSAVCRADGSGEAWFALYVPSGAHGSLTVRAVPHGDDGLDEPVVELFAGEVGPFVTQCGDLRALGCSEAGADSAVTVHGAELRGRVLFAVVRGLEGRQGTFTLLLERH